MLDFAFVVLFILLPLATWWATRSLTWTLVALTLSFGLAGNGVQTLVSMGVSWNARGLQWLVVALMATVFLISLAKRATRVSIRRQFMWIVMPALLIGLGLILLRLLAPNSPELLSGVGYLVNHPLAEDNAKWLHLTSQLADGRDLRFDGYAGGPLLLVLSMMAALISALSITFFGGVNEVAVAVHSVIGTQFLLIAVVPFVLAPFAESKVALRNSQKQWIPWPFLGSSMFVLFLASAVITSYGHLSLQFVLFVLALWAVVFVIQRSRNERIAMSLAVATLASVWVPLNVMAVAIVAVCLIWSLRARSGVGIALTAFTVVAVWDAVISSIAFLLGINLAMTSAGQDARIPSVESVAAPSIQSVIAEQLATARSLFTAPGGVEQIQPIIGLLALTATLFAAWLLISPESRSWRGYVRFAPIIALSMYVLFILVADAVTTGTAPNYGGHKLVYAATITSLVATLPVAMAGLDRGVSGMSPVRWFAVGGVVFALAVDTTLPRAISALSPVLWSNPSEKAPPWWSLSEVRPQPEQGIGTLPIACVVSPAELGVPTALPLGQEIYNCTRLLTGLNGLEGQSSGLAQWLQTDWLSNQPQWSNFYDQLVAETADFRDRTVILLNSDGEVTGLTALGSLFDRNDPLP